ncbi:hypothetical protein M5689_008231 [Euphorbia peplus]|nr:hypothetical protein M5689_008231 [Euphorbia peplus]
MDAYTVHLAMAAVVRAPLVAILGYYMHRKTLNKLLEFAKTVEGGRDGDSDVESPQHLKKHGGRRKIGRYYRHARGLFPMSRRFLEWREMRSGMVCVLMGLGRDCQGFILLLKVVMKVCLN